MRNCWTLIILCLTLFLLPFSFDFDFAFTLLADDTKEKTEELMKSYLFLHDIHNGFLIASHSRKLNARSNGIQQEVPK